MSKLSKAKRDARRVICNESKALLATLGINRRQDPAAADEAIREAGLADCLDAVNASKTVEQVQSAIDNWIIPNDQCGPTHESQGSNKASDNYPNYL